jgi:hypothetical protein
VALDDLPDDRQPEPGVAVLGNVAVAAVEPAEHPALVGGGDAHAWSRTAM